MTTMKTTTIIDATKIRLDELILSLQQVAGTVDPVTARVKVRVTPGDRPWEADSYGIEVTGTPKGQA